MPGGIITQGFQQPNIVKVRLNVAALLQGPYDGGTGMMNDALRAIALAILTIGLVSLIFAVILLYAG